MSQQEEFLPFITDDQGRSLIEQGGVVVTNAIPTPQETSPQGWEKNTIQFERSIEFWAVMRSYTTPLKFYEKAAYILRYYYYTFGMEVVLFFIWLKLDLTFGGNLEHKSWYKGQPDFATFKDSDEGVEINITEGGLYKDIQANKAIMSEYPLKDDEDAVSLLLDGLEIQQKLNFIVTDGDLADDFGMHTVDMPLVSVEKVSEITASSQERRHFTNNADLVANSIPFTVTGNSANNPITIETGFSVLTELANGIGPNNFAGALLQVRVFPIDSAIATAGYPLFTWGNTGNYLQFYGVNTHINITTTINVPANHRCFMLMFLTIGGVIATGSGADEVIAWHYSNLETDFIRMTYPFKFKETTIPAFRAVDLGRKIIDKISKGVSTLKSDLLENDYNLLIANGDAVRGIEAPVVKTKLQDYTKSIDAVKCICLGVEDNDARIEKRKYAFGVTEISNLGISSKLVSTTATEYIYNSIDNGYPSRDIGDVNGKYSICNGVTYKTPSRVKNVYDIKSVYLADPYVIEILRINLDGKTTTDNQSDNDVFFIDAELIHAPITGQLIFSSGIGGDRLEIVGQVGLNIAQGTRYKIVNGLNAGYYNAGFLYESGGSTFITLAMGIYINEVINTTIEFRAYRLRRKPYTSITGVPSPATIFNLELTPKTNLINHYEWIHSALEFMENKFITCETIEKNGKLIRTDAAGVVIKEKEDILISSLGNKIYIPHFLTFEAETPVNLLDKINTAGGIGFFSIDTFRGFPIKITTNDATLETQEYKILATADTILTPLIER